MPDERAGLSFRNYEASGYQPTRRSCPPGRRCGLNKDWLEGDMAEDRACPGGLFLPLEFAQPPGVLGVGQLGTRPTSDDLVNMAMMKNWQRADWLLRWMDLSHQGDRARLYFLSSYHFADGSRRSSLSTTTPPAVCWRICKAKLEVNRPTASSIFVDTFEPA